MRLIGRSTQIGVNAAHAYPQISLRSPHALPFLLIRSRYQTRHALARTIGASALHENAFWNARMFDAAPLTR
jgi:hypothetical protein